MTDFFSCLAYLQLLLLIRDVFALNGSCNWECLYFRSDSWPKTGTLLNNWDNCSAFVTSVLDTVNWIVFWKNCCSVYFIKKYLEILLVRDFVLIFGLFPGPNSRSFLTHQLNVTFRFSYLYPSVANHLDGTDVCQMSAKDCTEGRGTFCKCIREYNGGSSALWIFLISLCLLLSLLTLYDL